MGRTEPQLEKASEHVKYELEMLTAALSFLSNGPDETNPHTWNAYLESFVIHIRSVIDFLYPPTNRQPDDILAEEYVTDVAQWNRDRPAKTNLLRDAKKKADKQVAHLTYVRVGADKDWNWKAIWSDLENVAICFFDHLPPGRKTWFEVRASTGPTGPTGAPSRAVERGHTGPAGPKCG